MRHQARKVRTVVQEPLQPLAETREPVQHFRLQSLDREQRDQTHHRANAQPHSLIVRQIQHVIEELVRLVPEADVRAVHAAHRFGDIEEMLEEFAGDVLIHVIVLGEFQGNAHQIQRIHRHPAGAVRLIDVAAGGQLCAAIEYADVVQAQKSALKNISPQVVLAVHPPREVQHQLVKHALEKLQVAVAAAPLAVDLIDAPGGPGMHRRVHIAECPFIGGNLTVGVHVPFARQQHQLMLGELGVDQCEGDAVERQIPGRVPGILPLVRHGNDVGVIEIAPFGIAAVQARLRRGYLAGITLEPARSIQAVELLAPNQPGECLALHHALVGRDDVFLQVGVVLIGFCAALVKQAFELVEGRREHAPRQPQPVFLPAAGGENRLIPHAGLGAGFRGIDPLRMAADDPLVKTILEIAGGAGVPEPRGIGFVLGEQ